MRHIATDTTVNTGPKLTNTLITCMRNEAPFLLEWVAYHQAIGFQRIIVFSNDSTDGTDTLLDALAAQGIVEHVQQQVLPDQSPQATAAATARSAQMLKDGDWAIFLDADEFLNVQQGEGKVEDLIDFIESRGKIGMLVNWRVFGDSYHDSFQGRIISHDYTRCEKGLKTTQFKTFFQKNDETAGISKYLHLCDLEPEKTKLARFMGPDGSEFSIDNWTTTDRQRRWLDAWIKDGACPYGSINGAFEKYEIAQINHYMVRDPFSFALKKERGRGYTVQDTKPRHTDQFYQTWNRNEGDDTTILRWEIATRDRVAELTEVCGIQQQCHEISKAYQARFKDTKEHNRDAFPLTLPKHERHLVRQMYANSKGVVEYGSGGSTMLAARMGTPVVSVESSVEWTQQLQTELARLDQRHETTVVSHVDIGPTKKWGYPVNNDHFQSFWRYPLEPWIAHQEFRPDTVLIDGRMRVGCFVATLAMIKSDVCILFDDYSNRRAYHRVEQFLKPTEMVGRMAVFHAKPGLIEIADFAAFVPMLFNLR